MSVIHYFPGLKVGDNGDANNADQALGQLRAIKPNSSCAFNLTRRQLLSADIAIVSAYNKDLRKRLLAIGTDYGQPLWVVPLIAISPSSVRTPVDLALLNDEGEVLAVVDSFPRNNMTVVPSKATSVLVLTAEYVAKGAIVTGDRLVFGSFDEVQRKLSHTQVDMADPPKPFSASNDRSFSHASSDGESPVTAQSPYAKETEAESKNEDIVTPSMPPGGLVAPAGRPAATDPKPWLKNAPARNWFVRLIAGEPPDPRMPRESLPGLISFYFTGGAPVEHPVRDISLSGLYIVTQERWYIGTVLRITLSDRVGAEAERSLTLNAKVVRHGTDGVGLKFILDDEVRQEKSVDLVDHSSGVSRAKLQEFLFRLKHSG